MKHSTRSIPGKHQGGNGAVPGRGYTLFVKSVIIGRSSTVLGHRILIADDEPDIRNVLRRLLLSEGFCVCEAGDGYEALAAANTCEVSVIVIDILMPGMNGSEAIRTLRANPRFARTPILIITGH